MEERKVPENNGKETSNSERKRPTVNKESFMYKLLQSNLTGGRRGQPREIPTTADSKVSSEHTCDNSRSTVGSSKKSEPHSETNQNTTDRPRNWNGTVRSGAVSTINEHNVPESCLSIESNRHIPHSETNQINTDRPRNFSNTVKSGAIARKDELNLQESYSSKEINRHDGCYSQVSGRNKQNKTIYENELNYKCDKEEYSTGQKEKNVFVRRSLSFADKKENRNLGDIRPRPPEFNSSKSYNQKYQTYNHDSFKGSTGNNIDDDSKWRDCHSKHMPQNYSNRDSDKQFKNSSDYQNVQKDTNRLEELSSRNRRFFRSKSEGSELLTNESSQECQNKTKNSGNISVRLKSRHYNERPDESVLLSPVSNKTNSEINEFKQSNYHSKSVSSNKVQGFSDEETFDENFRIKPSDLRSPKRNIKVNGGDKITVSVLTDSPFLTEEVNETKEGDFSNYIKDKSVSSTDACPTEDICKPESQEIGFFDIPNNVSCSNDVFFQPDSQEVDCFSIPPPHPRNYGNDCCSPGQTSGYISIGELDALEGEVHYSPERIKEITSYLKEIEDEHSKSFTMAQQVIDDINKVVRYHFKGDRVVIYGSYLSNLAITSSNINLAVQSNQPPKNSYLADLRKFMYQKMQEETRFVDNQYYVDSFEPDPHPKRSKIYFSDSEFGIQCEVVYFGSKVENYRKMNYMLRDLCLLDKRVKTIIIAARFFAEESALHDAKYGRLHVVSFALMVVYFLQQLEPPVLPIVDTTVYIDIKTAVKELRRNYNSASLGELWLDFLKFYSQTFDWENDVICITTASRISKREKNWKNHLIAIEDPFTGKNIAESVQSSEVAEHVQYCFKNFYEKSLSPTSDADSESSENEAELSNKYSFNLCKQLKDNLPSCAECDELGGPCGACYKLVPDVEKVPEIDRESLKYVRSVLNDVVGKNILSEGNIKGRKAYVRNLEKCIQKKYGLANLSLYGSSVNGFGFSCSDLDICMSFRKKMHAQPVQILRGVANFLRRDNTYENVIGIYFAKIPLIKFSSKESLGWKCEISLSNALAVHNSRLLNTYAEFDPRCKILGCALKLLAKKSGIAECVTKTLSSYSYIIMTIHYLQQIIPPVLPVFPILHKEEFENNVILPEKVIKHNHWLREDVFQLQERYEYAGHNKMDIAELWLGLLDFYLQYDLSNAITIIQKEPLPASTLQRHARLFNIQDPFLHDKNLGWAVSNEKAQEIMRIFHGARVLFGKEKPKSVTNLKNHYFSTMNLTGKYIKDLDCSLCGAYGHDLSKCKKSNQQQSCGKFYFKHKNRV